MDRKLQNEREGVGEEVNIEKIYWVCLKGF